MKFILFLLQSIMFRLYAYDSTQTLINVWLSGAAYCDKNDYSTMKLSGEAYGFIYKNTIYDIHTDIQGFVGFIPIYKTIYVVFRGTSSLLNWMSDFEVKQTKYLSYPECDCNIHYGFYRATMNLKNETIRYISQLKTLYSSYNIIITGHSLGAAIAQVLSMELLKEGYNLELYNYGQPRVGDNKYALFVNNKIKNYWRFTHNKDIVPHLPPIEGFKYYHSCREVFEDQYNKLNLCSNINCEDYNCSDQYTLKKTIVNDHYYYIGHRVSCDESTYKQSKRILSNIIIQFIRKL